MPFIQIPDAELEYGLIAYDENGAERADDRDGIMTERVLNAVTRDPITDIFVMSHGWKGDIPSATTDYTAWVKTMADCTADRSRAKERPGFRPLVVGLHWPSLPFGDEAFGGTAISFAAGEPSPVESQVEAYAERIANTGPARAALRTIFLSALKNSAPPTLPQDVREAYIILNREAAISSGGEGATPGDDREAFDPEDRYQLAQEEAPVSYGIRDVVVGSILSPLRQLSFWKMKDRARKFGESGGHTLLQSLFSARPDLRVHLMGHSFGCIVMSATVAGPVGGPGLPKQVQSLVLVQGALSLWSYCSDIPVRKGRAGYFRPVVDGNRVAGPIVTTRSRFDLAVGRWYPLGAGAARQVTFAPDSLPTYGGVGTFGLQGPGLDLHDGMILRVDHPYDFQPGRIYNLECSGVIRDGDGVSGAHSDIAHPEIAHVIWSAAMV